MDLRAHVTELGRIRNAPTPVVSVYLDTRWADEHQRDRVRVFVKNEIEKARRADGAGTLGPDLAWIEATVEEIVAQARFPDAHGIALFACSGLGLRDVVPMRVRFDEAFVVGDVPFLTPLAGALETAPAALIAFVDGKSARLIAVGPEETSEEVALDSEVPGHHRRGDWANLAMSRYQRHIQDHRDRHYEAVAGALIQMVESHGLERIVLAGEPRNVALFRQHLPERVAHRVAGSIIGARHDRPTVLVARARALLGHIEAQDEAEAVDRVVTEAAKGGRAVAGVDATLDAVNRGAVHDLHLLKSFSETGRACSECGSLQRGAPDPCRVCQGPTRTVDLASAMGDRVLATGGRVETIDRHAELARLGGVAARLRYPL